jgi:hypothetical protein
MKAILFMLACLAIAQAAQSSGLPKLRDSDFCERIKALLPNREALMSSGVSLTEGISQDMNTKIHYRMNMALCYNNVYYNSNIRRFEPF